MNKYTFIKANGNGLSQCQKCGVVSWDCFMYKVKEFDERTKRIKYKKCPECHGEGKRYVTTCITLRQGNFQRKDGSYHFEKDGTEREDHHEWKTCPDCKGTGKVRE